MERSPRIYGRKDEIRRIKGHIRRARAGASSAVLIEGERGIGKSTLLESAISGEDGISVIRLDFLPDRKNIPLSGLLEIEGMREAILSDREAFFGEIFLINNYGILIAHESNVESDMDEDILGSMLTAVQDFVKDSFGGEGGLGKLEYGEKKILIEHGESAFMAAVINGEEHPRMRADMRKTLEEIEDRMGSIFLEWDGDVGKISDAIPFLKALTSRRYLIKGSLEDIDLESEQVKVLEKVMKVLERIPEPRIIAAEDLHWADELSLMALGYALRNLESTAIIGTYRGEELGRRSGEILESMDAEVLHLSPLDHRDIGSIVQEMFSPSEFSEGFIRRIAEHSGGNPFYAREIALSLKDEGVVYLDEGIWRNSEDEISLPRTVSELISWRLDRLSRNELNILELLAASVSADMDVLERAAGMQRDELESIIVSLEEKKMVIRDGDTVRFYHSGVRERTYEEMSQRWRLVTHKALGDVLEEITGAEGDAVYSLAYHFSRSLEREKGIRYSCMAGERASASYAISDAIGYYEVALSIMEGYMPGHSQKNEVLERLGELYSHTGQYDKALRSFESLLASCERPRRIYRKMAEIYRKTGEYDKAMRKCEEGLRAEGEEMEGGRIKGIMGAIYLRKGEMDRAMECYEEYLRIARESGNLSEESSAYRALGGAYFHKREVQKAVEMWERSMETAESAGDLLKETYALINLGVAYRALGKLEDARMAQEKALEVARKTEDIYVQAQILNNLGTIYYMMGDFRRQIEAWEESLRIKRRIGDKAGAANIYNNLGVAYYETGRYEISAEYLERSLKLFEDIGDVRGIAKALCNLALPYAALKRHEVLDIVRRAEETIKERGFQDLIPNLWRSRIMAFASIGDMEGAEREFSAHISEILENYGDMEQWICTKLDFARHLSMAGERKRAREELQDVLEASEKHGMRRYLTIAQQMLKELED